MRVANADAELMVFDDPMAWQAAAGPTRIEDFEEAPLQYLMTGPAFEFAEHRVGRISIGARGDRLGIDMNPTIRDTVDGLSPNGSRHLGGVLSNVEVIMEVAILFDNPVKAFAADWASASNRSGIRLDIGEERIELSDHLAGEGDGFIGIVASEPFGRVMLSARLYEDYGLDNVRFAVPEPSTLLLALGLAACGLSPRRTLLLRR